MGCTLSRTTLRIEIRRGQALVEAAMVLPLLLLVLVGIMEIGRAWNIRQVVTHAAREGARAGAIKHYAGQAEAKSAAEDAAERSLLAASIPIDPSPVDVQGTESDSEEIEVTVDVEYRFFLIGPVMSLIMGRKDGGKWDVDVIHLKSKAVMRNE